jgi:hypothetical protein
MASSRLRTTLALSVTLAVRLDLFFRRLCRWFHDGVGSGIVADVRTAPGYRVFAVRHSTQEMAMAQRRSVLIALMLLVCAGLPACGTTGKTSSLVLTLDLPKGQKAGADIRIASAAMDANAAHLTAVKARPWGKFGLDDLRNLEHSLRDTIAPHLPTTSHSTESRLDIHLVIRRYVVGVSNSGGAVLACVAWAATGSNRTLIYEEQFYASDAGYLIGTIGLLKDSVHEAIVRRIATTSLALAADPAAAHPRPTTFDKTSTSLDEAVARLPRVIEMVPLGVPTPISPILGGLANWPLVAAPAFVLGTLIEIIVFDGGPFRRSGESTMQWEVANPSDNFDWQGYLEKLYPSR